MTFRRRIQDSLWVEVLLTSFFFLPKSSQKGMKNCVLCVLSASVKFYLINFHAFCGKNWQNERLMPPSKLSLPVQEILDLPLNILFFHTKTVCHLFPLGFEPRTSRVFGERDNHYTMETDVEALNDKKQRIRYQLIIWGQSTHYLILQIRKCIAVLHPPIREPHSGYFWHSTKIEHISHFSEATVSLVVGQNNVNHS